MRTYPFISNYLQSSGWELAKGEDFGKALSLTAISLHSMAAHCTD